MPADPWNWKIERVVPSKAAAARRVIRDVLSQLETHGWTPADMFGVHLALEEALANAIKHGNGLDKTKRVHLVCKLSPDRIWIEIRDEGPGFNPAQVPDCTETDSLCLPSGRGVMLMKAYMSRVEYNQTGNCVVMEKVRARPA